MSNNYPYIEPGNVPAQNFQDFLSLKEDKASKGIANGYAPLDATAKVPSANLPAATTSVSGLMSSADKTKLDGLGQPTPSIQFSNTEQSFNWFKSWGRSYGSLGYVQFCPIPLTPAAGAVPAYNGEDYAAGVFTDPGHNIEFSAPFVQDMLENPAHGLPFLSEPMMADYKLYYSYTSKPSFIGRWRIRGEHWWSRPHSLENSAGRVVNFTAAGIYSAYPTFGTKCTDARSMVRQGAYSHGAVNGIATVADFVLAQTAQFKLGICVDAVSNSLYRPEQIIVARGVANGSGGPSLPIVYATEISSAVKATSPTLTGLGAHYPRLVIFNVSCNAGDTITVQFKTPSIPTRAMAVSMFTFDPL